MFLSLFQELGGVLVGLPGVFVSLLGEFMSGEVVAFAVGGCCGLVGMGGDVVKFCGPVVRALWHLRSPLRSVFMVGC